MAWLWLSLAGCAEVVGAVNLKLSNGFTRVKYILYCVLWMGGSLYLLSLSLSDIPIGTAYAIWTGIGAIGTTFVGMLYFGERITPGRIAAILVVLIGVVGLKMTS